MRSFLLLFSFLLIHHLSAQVEQYIYISSRNTNSVKYYQSDGAYLGDFTAPNAGGLSKTQDLLFHPHDGTLIVTGIDNSSIKRYDPQTGDSLGQFISSANLDGPVGLWQNEVEEWLVVDWTKGSVEHFDSQGAYLGAFISGLDRVEGHTFDADGNIYLCDWAKNVVNRYLPDGTFDGEFINTGGLLAPNSIIFGPAPAASAVSEKATLEKDVHIYPNPGMDSFVISSPALIGKTLAIQVFSPEGRVAWEKKSFKFTGEETISAESWPAGTYSCKIWVDENSISKLLIKK